MAKLKTDSAEDTPVENNGTSDSVIDISTFMTLDGVSPTWINGLMVYLAKRGGTGPRLRSEWQKLLSAYQSLS